MFKSLKAIFYIQERLKELKFSTKNHINISLLAALIYLYTAYGK
jgi:hypothetical protein